jgi:outer membrane protein assembly factor BamD (BamD/ComL family)
MIRAAILVSFLLGIAPFQCGGSNRDHDLRREDTAGDALYGLSERFREEKNEPARRATLKYLVDRYPSNRYAPIAREELGSDANANASAGGGDAGHDAAP